MSDLQLNPDYVLLGLEESISQISPREGECQCQVNGCAPCMYCEILENLKQARRCITELREEKQIKFWQDSYEAMRLAYHKERELVAKYRDTFSLLSGGKLVGGDRWVVEDKTIYTRHLISMLVDAVKQAESKEETK